MVLVLLLLGILSSFAFRMDWNFSIFNERNVAQSVLHSFQEVQALHRYHKTDVLVTQKDNNLIFTPSRSNKNHREWRIELPQDAKVDGLPWMLKSHEGAEAGEIVIEVGSTIIRVDMFTGLAFID